MVHQCRAPWGGMGQFRPVWNSLYVATGTFYPMGIYDHFQGVAEDSADHILGACHVLPGDVFGGDGFTAGVQLARQSGIFPLPRVEGEAGMACHRKERRSKNEVRKAAGGFCCNDMSGMEGQPKIVNQL